MTTEQQAVAKIASAEGVSLPVVAQSATTENTAITPEMKEAAIARLDAVFEDIKRKLKSDITQVVRGSQPDSAGKISEDVRLTIKAAERRDIGLPSKEILQRNATLYDAIIDLQTPKFGMGDAGFVYAGAYSMRGSARIVEGLTREFRKFEAAFQKADGAPILDPSVGWATARWDEFVGEAEACLHEQFGTKAAQSIKRMKAYAPKYKRDVRSDITDIIVSVGIEPKQAARAI